MNAYYILCKKLILIPLDKHDITTNRYLNKKYCGLIYNI